MEPFRPAIHCKGFLTRQAEPLQVQQWGGFLQTQSCADDPIGADVQAADDDALDQACGF